MCIRDRLQAGHAAQHAAESGFDAGGDLVVTVAGGDAVDKRALLVAVGKGQIVTEGAVGRELAGAGSGGGRILPRPRLRARNLHRAGVGNVGEA